ncbi:MAG: FHA domain-containing protein, partial [Myxococcota bacterium]
MASHRGKGPDPTGPTERLHNELASAGPLVLSSPFFEAYRGRAVPLNDQALILGSDPEKCDVVLRDSSVSRTHVRVSRLEGGVLVEDLGSTNGTRYLGHAIERAMVKPGARLELGRCVVDVLPASTTDAIPISARERYGGIVGQSLGMRRVFGLLESIEKAAAPVLIGGETGTGKDLVARAIHSHSTRSEAPFVVIDCANLPASLIEDELFGHVKGAFTGATQDKNGAFADAHEGTVFLDEIGELPVE